MIIPNYAQEQSLINLQKSKQNGNNKYLIVLPSGIGKTYLSAFETFNFKGYTISKLLKKYKIPIRSYSEAMLERWRKN